MDAEIDFFICSIIIIIGNDDHQLEIFLAVYLVLFSGLQLFSKRVEIYFWFSFSSVISTN